MLRSYEIPPTVKRLFRLLAPYSVSLGLAVALSGLACAAALFIPVFLRYLIDQSLSHAGGNTSAVAGLVFAVVAQVGLGLGAALLVGRAGQRLARDLRVTLYRRLQRTEMAYFDATPTGSLISRLTDDVSAVQNLVSPGLLTLLTELGTAVVAAAMLGWLSPRLLLVAFAVLPAFGLAIRNLGRVVRVKTLEVRTILDAIFGQLKEKLDGVLVVKAHATEPSEVREFSSRVWAAHEPRLRAGRLSVAFGGVSIALSSFAALLTFALAAWEVAHGRMTPGAAASAVAFAALVFGPLPRVVDAVSLFQHAAACLGRIDELLDRPIGETEPMSPATLARASGRVEFDCVTFAYGPGRPALEELRLVLEPGKRVAVVGPTGSGKSTIVSLLLRFYDPQRGEIRLDGIPLERLPRRVLRRQIGLVPQDPLIFRGTLADNIRYGSPAASLSRVHEAAAAALVHEIAKRLPAGYDTIIGEGGHKLSHGERQRVAIARAICADPAIVVLDEATSALDPHSERQIQVALDRLLAHRTALIIAHRLTTVMSADEIIVLNGGRIVEHGDHRRLLAAGGCYRQLFERQFVAALDSPVQNRQSEIRNLRSKMRSLRPTTEGTSRESAHGASLFTATPNPQPIS